MAPTTRSGPTVVARRTQVAWRTQVAGELARRRFPMRPAYWAGLGESHVRARVPAGGVRDYADQPRWQVGARLRGAPSRAVNSLITRGLATGRAGRAVKPCPLFAPSGLAALPAAESPLAGRCSAWPWRDKHPRSPTRLQDHRWS